MFDLPGPGSPPRLFTVILGLLLAYGGPVVPASGQLSPGKLSRAHAALGGLKNCGDCHRLGDRQVQDKCLHCHTEIAGSRQDGRGLHARGAYQTCTDCHVEHQGEDYELIFWPDGIEGFAHEQTGWPLTGHHADLACRRCHRAQFIQDPEYWRQRGKNLDRTYFGLTSACLGCHEDLHRGQFPADCTACHFTLSWRPTEGFAHERTRFPLTGRHVQVECVRCHPPLPGEEATSRARLYSGIAHGACSDCHRDPHGGALGPQCAGCHATDGWRQVDGAAFDHDRTAYPLRGRHAGLACARCHSGDRRRPAHAACSDCHADAHGGGPAGKPQLLRCQDCHDVQGFRPAAFSLDDHARTGFPLQGAHLAVPCDLCHRSAEGSPESGVNLSPPHRRCVDCHADPHAGQARRLAGEAGCSHCHVEDSWHQVGFDHGVTGFTLTGRHRSVSCRACHPAPPDTPGLLRLVDTPRACAACHQDPHGDQFQNWRAADDGPVACDRCHVTRDWLAELFDHDRDSRFPLRGGHEKVACRACHPQAAGSESGLLRFKPLPTRCQDCHSQISPIPEETDE